MIESLHIENVAVVKCLDVDFHGGMTVLSGETGAGKSIIIDSLNLLLGGRADRELIRTGEEKCLVSALFGDLSERTLSLLSELGFEAEESLMLSRTVTKSGSSARLNGRAIPLSVLREISGTLFNIHGQNDNQQLLDPAKHVDLLDAYGGSGELRSEYAELYRQVLHLRAQIDSLRRDARERTRLGESLRYQLAEINKVSPKRGEEEALSELTKRLRSLERIQQCVALVEKALQGGEKGRGAIYLSERAASAMESLGDAIPEAERLAARLQDVRYELEDIASSVSELSDLDDGDALEKLDRAEARLDAIAKLKRKYGSTVEEILAYRDRIDEELYNMDNAEDRIAELREELGRIEAAAKERADALSHRRRKAAVGLTAAVTENLAFLDMPKVRFEVAIVPTEDFCAVGRDRVEFLISTNPGDPLLPMVKIASGGELARIMLSLKNILNTCDGVHTVIFDEIDTGISGKTSRKVGIKLKEIGRELQVICVTHSAQIASLAHNHLYISKTEADGRVQTTLRELDGEGRVEEIARILGGIHITEVQRRAAKEMIAEGEQYG